MTPQPPSRVARQHAACVALPLVASVAAGRGWPVPEQAWALAYSRKSAKAPLDGFEITIAVYIEYFIYTTGAVTALRSSRVELELELELELEIRTRGVELELGEACPKQCKHLVPLPWGVGACH